MKPGRSPSGIGRLGKEDAATTVEFAIVAPLLLLLLFALIDFSRLAVTMASVRTASREGARYGAAIGDSPNSIPRYSDCTEIRTAAKSIVPSIRLPDANIVITYDAGPSTSDVAACGSGPSISPSLIDRGDRVKVRTSVVFTSNTPFVARMLHNLTLSSTNSRTIFK